jgi:DNA-binding response OmpR family regulator
MFSDKRIMIVEDSKTVKLQLKLILDKLGVTVIEVSNEWAMFKKIEEYGKLVDLIIMDLVLKSEDGLDLIHKLKEDKRYRNIPILVLTEQADIPNVLKAKELGIKNYLRKPIKREKLVERISTIFNIL